MNDVETNRGDKDTPTKDLINEMQCLVEKGKVSAVTDEMVARCIEISEELISRTSPSEEVRTQNVKEFAACIARIHFSLWQVFGHRDLTDDEEQELRSLLFHFYVKIK